jgi:hypothetical protein
MRTPLQTHHDPPIVE